MVDPITAGIGALTAAAGSTPSWLPWAGLAGSAGLAAGSLLSGKGSTAPPEVNLPQQPGVNPSITPNQKPQRKSQQQSFLSGAAMAQQQGAAPAQGKSLLGA